MGRGYPPEWYAAQDAKQAGRSLSLADFADKVPRDKRQNRAGLAIRNALEQADKMRKEDAWQQANPEHFVAIWAQLHGHVYGVEPEVIASVHQWGKACTAAAIVLSDGFANDRAAMIDYVRWAWARENARRERGSQGRLAWQFLFGMGMLTDYKVAMTKKGKK